MNLALVFQKALSEITKNGTPIINIHCCQSDFIFTGTTYNALLKINSRNKKTKTQQKNGPDVPKNYPEISTPVVENEYPRKQ